VTRDRNFARADWAGRDFFIVDTGGVIEGSDEPSTAGPHAGAGMAVDEADVILFVVDGKEGVHPLDEMAELLPQVGKPVVLVVNKLDNLPRDRATSSSGSSGWASPCR
jgi:GTPase